MAGKLIKYLSLRIWLSKDAFETPACSLKCLSAQSLRKTPVGKERASCDEMLNQHLLVLGNIHFSSSFNHHSHLILTTLIFITLKGYGVLVGKFNSYVLHGVHMKYLKTAIDCDNVNGHPSPLTQSLSSSISSYIKDCSSHTWHSYCISFHLPNINNIIGLRHAPAEVNLFTLFLCILHHLSEYSIDKDEGWFTPGPPPSIPPSLLPPPMPVIPPPLPTMPSLKTRTAQTTLSRLDLWYIFFFLRVFLYTNRLFI